MKHILHTLLFLVYSLPAASTETDATQQRARVRCQELTTRMASLRQTETLRAEEQIETLMSGVTERLFDLNCVNGISLRGGVRIYGGGANLLAQSDNLCARINQWTDRLRQRISGKLELGNDTHMKYHIRVRPVRKNPSAKKRDLNGDPLDTAPSRTSSEEEQRLLNTLKDLFR